MAESLRKAIKSESINIPSPETVVDRLSEYLLPPELLEIKPTSLDRARREGYKKGRPGCDYSFIAYRYYSDPDHLDVYENKTAIVPAWHPITTESQISHATQYGTGMFEGGSIEPVANEKGEITGANAILVQPRLNRMFGWSVPGRPGVQPPVTREDFEQAMLDYAAILGEKVLVSPEGLISRAYVRPSIAPGEGPLGIGIKGQVINANIEAWNWPSYFPDPERVYAGTGLVVALGPNQRLSPIHGKHASNYGEAASVGNLARKAGADEALYLGPYLVNPDESRGDEIILDYHKNDLNLIDLIKQTVIADGPGEEVMAITKSGELWIPPKDVNRLGGTTAASIMEYLAPELGLKAEEHRFTFNDIFHEGNTEGRIVGLFFAGNAVRIAPIGEIRLYGSNSEPFGKYKLQIPYVLRRLVNQYESEVRGILPPSDPLLLMPIDLESGRKARELLDRIYIDWFK